MRICFLCHRIPYPPDKGDKIRAYHALRGIAERHDVDLFTLIDNPADLDHESAIARFCRKVNVARIYPRLARWKTLPYMLTRTPLTLPWFHSSELAGEVSLAFRKRSYDRVFVYSSAMVPYVDRPDSPPMITDLVDVDSDKWMQYSRVASFPYSAVYRREARVLRDYERKVCRRSSAVVVTTMREAQLIQEISPDANVHVIPNGVDSEYFSPSILPACDVRGEMPSTVTFLGDMSYFPNEEAVSFFAERVFPRVRASVPAARFVIVGRRPTRRVQRLARLAGVEVTGWVPDVRPWLLQSHVSVVPFSIAAGIQNKVLEAMACGLPVVGTVRAVQGLSDRIARLVETANEPEHLAEAVVRYLRHPEEARRRGMECREQVVAAYSWPASIGHFQNLLENPRRTRAQEGNCESPVNMELLTTRTSGQ